MGDVIIKPFDQSALPDDLSQVNAIQPSHWNAAREISGGTDGQLMAFDSGSSTGASSTSTPSVTTVVYPLTTPSSPAIGAVWVEESAGIVTINVKKSDGTIVSLSF